MLAWPFKDPDEILDYAVDWSDRLAGDTISSSAWTVPTGITSTAQTTTTTKTTIWLSGGTDGQTYALLNRIVTASGRTMDQSVRIKISRK